MNKFLTRKISTPKFWAIVGFSALAIFALILIFWRFWSFPNGLTDGEIAAATISGHFSFANFAENFAENLTQLVNLPWTIVESASFALFGASAFAMRLPAAIFLLLAISAIIFTIYKWSRISVAIISGFALISSTIFLGLARSGIPESLTILLISLIILFATIILLTEKRGIKTTILKILLGICGALLVYSRGGIFIAAILVLVALIHPKTRLLFWRLKPWKIIVGIFIGLMILSPLIFGFCLQFSSGNFNLARELFALNDGGFSLENLQNLAGAFFSVFGGFAGGLILPIFSVVGAIIAILGILKICADVFSARAYLVLSLLISALVLSAWSAEFLYLLLIPFALALAVGFDVIINSWYKLFPVNPYARGLAVALLAALIVGVGWADVSRYFANENYSAAIYNYNQEFSAARNVLSRAENRDATLIVAKNQREFYEILSRGFPSVRILTEIPKDFKTENSTENSPNSAETSLEISAENNQNNENDENNNSEKSEKTSAKKSETLVILNSARKIDENFTEIPREIITNSRAKNSVLLRVY